MFLIKLNYQNLILYLNVKKMDIIIKRFFSIITLAQAITITTFSSFILSSYSEIYANDFQTYFNKGFKKGEKADYFGAIYDYTASI